MAYLSLYRKYRPQTFDEILGQGHVSQTLTNALVEDRVAHAYLFTGPRGTGKTSTARILAKALNCVQGPTPSPCGTCASCVAITNGSSLDVIEMDAASHSKVDETREVLAGVSLATAGGRKKVYVIDEVHMLSTPAFNALLKTLEEPPDHVVFILATTEAHKVLSTIVSRTQRFDFRRVPTETIETHLAHIAKLEDIDVDPEALGVVARHADGGVRDALSALDQLSSITGHVTVLDAEALLGDRNEDSFFQLFDAIAAEDVGAVLVTLHSLVGQGADPRRLATGVLGHARSLLLLRTAPDSEGLLDVSGADLETFRVQAERFSAELLLRILDLCSTAVTDMRSAPDHKLLLEIALVRAAAPENDPSALGLQGRIERLERRMGIAESGSSQAAAARPQPAPAVRSEPVPERATTSPGPAATPKVKQTPQAKAPKETPTTAAPPETSAEAPAEKKEGSPGVPAAVGLGHVRDTWQATLQEVNRRSKRIWGLLNPSRPLKLDDDRLVVEVQSPFHESTMSEERNRAILAEALHSSLGISPSLGFMARGSTEPVSEEPAGEAPDAGAGDEAEEVADLDETTPVDEADQDPVELVKEGFGAEVVEERTPR